MEKNNNIDWRLQQQKFFNEDVIFLQDKRILDFFEFAPVLCIGDVGYFKKKLNTYKQKEDNQCLIIVNKKIKNTELVKLLKKYKNFKKLCISINKFCLYTINNNNKIAENYDIAILNLIKSIFHNREIEHYFVKELKGNHFNFASPTTQFFIT